MNEALTSIMAQHTPKISDKVVNGTAKQVLSEIPKYLDQFFRDSMRTVSKGIDFTYLGYRRLTPLEEYNLMVAKKDTTIEYDLSHNDVYIVEYRFEYMGQLISRPLYLPYAGSGNVMVMSSTSNHIMPVLSDTVVSPSPGGVFVRLLKAKLNFTAKARYFMVNGVKVKGSVINGVILRPKALVDKIGNPMISTSLYMLGKYGLIESLKRFGKVSEIMVTDKDVTPMDGWVVYTTTKTKPRGLKAIPYLPHNLHICVRGDNMDAQFVENLLFGVIYTADILPEISDDIVSLISMNSVKDEIEFWRIILGKVIYKNSYSVDRIYQDMAVHFDALEGYIDPIIKTKLRDGNVPVDDFFDLIAYILSNYNDWVLTSREYNSNIENRYIDILYYLTCDMIIGFNRVILNINKRATKTSTVSHKEVAKILSNELGTKHIYSLTKSSEPNLAVANCDYSGDLKYPKLTSVLEDRLVLSI